MTRLRVHCFSISIDGYGAGPNQSLKQPLGLGGLSLHEWIFPTRTFHEMQGEEGGTTDRSDDFAARGFKNIGAWILGRNMFGPIRGAWLDEHWKGWWGDNPPYHVPVFVLTNHPRKSFRLEGGTTFHFVTTGIHAALQQAPRQHMERTFVSAAESLPFGNIFVRDSSMRCMWLWPRWCSVQGSISLAISMCASSDTNAPNTCPLRTRHTS